MNPVTRAAAVGLISLATLLPMGSAANAAPNAASPGEVGALDWYPVVTYPGTTQGWKDCNADGKLWGGTYRCVLLLSGEYELQIWR